MKIAMITSGGAGMFCGSCMQDNTLVRSLRLAGLDAVLVPTYTPIRVDEENVSTERVFLGGINVYLDSMLPGWQFLPSWMTGWLNRTSVIQRLTALGNSTDPARLGSLTLDMLKGRYGPQRREIRLFTEFLCNDLKPDVILFSNALLSGVLSELRPKFSGRILCLLQGDDIFLEGLTARWKPVVMDQLIGNCRDFDAFLVHSEYYRQFMVEYLHLPADRIQKIPLTIDAADIVTPVDELSAASDQRRFRVGYFARLCPEKGIHNLLQAASEVLPHRDDMEVVIGGYLPDQHRQWFEQHLGEARATVRARQNSPDKASVSLETAVSKQEVTDVEVSRIFYAGSPDSRDDKLRLIDSFDVLCVPTDYREPKGLYVLEAGLRGVPSLVPAHGAFPELIDKLNCGILYDPTDPAALEDALRSLSGPLDDAHTLPKRVTDNYGMTSAGLAIREVIESLTK